MNIPRCEYPRPQLVREPWLNLNGEWDFEIDNAEAGESKAFFERMSLNSKITVPFCPESKLSGVEHTDFLNCVWYRRDIEIPKDWQGKNVILHFGAVDYLAVVYVNGKWVGEHRGGYTPFCFDITDYLTKDGNYITLCAYDDVRSGNQPAGKQSAKLDSYGCFYTRTTGIWQTVWLEAVDRCYIKTTKMTTEIDPAAVTIEAFLDGEFMGCEVTAEALWDGKPVGFGKAVAYDKSPVITLSLTEKHLWEVGNGNLYDLKLTVTKSGKVLDSVVSYFGLRTVSLDGKAFKLNGKTVFGRWVLDQGYYPDGLYTAPSDEALKADILYGMKLGFNGARLHQKVFEPRFLYWADKLGYLCWGEHANWGLDISEMGQIEHFLPEWIEAVERDFNHPSIIGWCPFNETQGDQCYGIIDMTYSVTKALDPTRPVIDTSGLFHATATDIYDIHEYEQNPEIMASYFEKLDEGIISEASDRYDHLKLFKKSVWDGKTPLFVSEYGGARWAQKERENGSWGYGSGPKTVEEFIERYKGLTRTIMDNPYFMGFCYTQLYDIEQEENGLMTYDRKYKFDPQKFREINQAAAAIEKL